MTHYSGCAGFTEWALDNGVSLEHEEDYGIWLDCWNNGYNEALKDFVQIKDRKQLLAHVVKTLKEK